MELKQAKMRKRWDGWWILHGDHRHGPYNWEECKLEYQRGIENRAWLKESIGDR